MGGKNIYMPKRGGFGNHSVGLAALGYRYVDKMHRSRDFFSSFFFSYGEAANSWEKKKKKAMWLVVGGFFFLK